MSKQPQDKSQRPRRPPMRRGNNFSDTSGHTQARRPPMGRRQDPGPAAAPTQPVQQPASNQPNPMPAQFPIVPQTAVPYFPAQHPGLMIRQVPLQFPQPVGGQPMPQTGPSGTQTSGAGGSMASTAQTGADQAQAGPPASGGRRPPMPQQQARFNPQFPGVPISQQQLAQMQQSGMGMIPQMLVPTGAMPQPMVGIPSQQVQSAVSNGSGVPATGGVGVSQPAATTQPQAPPTGPAVVPAAANTTTPAATESSPKKSRQQPWGGKQRPMVFGWARVRQVSSGQSLQIEIKKFYKRDSDSLASKFITLLLDCIVCPSIGRRKRKDGTGGGPSTIEFTPDEPFAFEAKEFTRKTLMEATRYNQQPVMFAAWNMTTTKNTKTPRYFGDIYIPNPDGGSPRSLSHLIVQAGWADLKMPNNPDRNDRLPGNLDQNEYARLRDALGNAQSNGLGKFQSGNEEKHKRNCFYTQDCRETLRKYRGQVVDAIVDYVVDGCTLRVEICPPGAIDQPRESNLQVRLAGVRIERNYGPKDPVLEAVAEEAKKFVESALLDHDVQLKFVTADERNLYAQILHPSKRRIAVALLGQGMADPVPWVQKEIEDPVEISEMKAALQVAQQNKTRIWKTKQVTEANDQMEYVTVVRVLSGDKLEVRYHNSNNSKEIVRLSSIRAPTRQQNGETEPFFRAAKEFLRSKTIGKQVQMYKDYEREQKMTQRNNDENRSEVTTHTITQVYATIYVGNQENVAQSLLQKGLARIIQHGPKDDPSRDYIKLHEASDQAQRSGAYKLEQRDEDAPLDFSNQDRPQSGGRGAPRGRGNRGGQRGGGRGNRGNRGNRGGGRGGNRGGGRGGGKRTPDARKLIQLFNQLKNQKRPTKCIVEMIFNATKFKLYVESANAFIPFQLMHIRCDRAPPPNIRNASTLAPGRSSGRPGLDAWRHCFDNLMQREVYITVLETADNVAKGNLVYNGGKNIAEELIELGLAEVYTWRPRGRDAQRSAPAPARYLELQDAALKAKLGLWRKIVLDEDVDEKERGASSAKIGQELSVVISHIESATEFFANLEEHSAKVDEVSLALAAYIRVKPKRFQKDRVYVGRYNGHWSRCKTIKRNANKDNSWFVIFMDYGNRAAIGEENMGACPNDFKDTSPDKYPALAIRCQLAGLRPPPKREHQELFNMTGEFFANNVLPSMDSDQQSKVLRFKVLYDTEILPQFRRRGALPSLWGELFDKEMSINKLMVREGYARLDENKNLMLLTNVEDDETTEYVSTIKTLRSAAFDSRTNIWMSGDINTDDEGE